jgi:hypothetical protein
MNFCPICNRNTQQVDVHGHTQCTVCGNNIGPCCQGENCNMDVYDDENNFQVDSVQKLP